MKTVLFTSLLISTLAMVGCSKEASTEAMQNAASQAQQHVDHADQAVTSAQAEMVAAAKKAAAEATAAAAKTEAATREAVASGAAVVENTAKDMKEDVQQ